MNAMPLKDTLRDALTDAIYVREDRIEDCADCRHTVGELCPDHLEDRVRADDYDALRVAIRGARTDAAAVAALIDLAARTEGKRAA